MRYRLRTLLMVYCIFAELSVSAIAANDEEQVQGPGKQPPIVVEWDELAFEAKDRSRVDLANLPDRVRELDGKDVCIRGYIYSSFSGSPHRIQQFLLIGEVKIPPMIMKDSRQLINERPIHQIAGVQLAPGQFAEFTMKPVAVTGRLTLKVISLEGTAVLVFQILATSVEPVERRSGYWPAFSSGC